MNPAGLEQNTPDPGKTAQLATGTAQDEAFLGDFAPNDPELIAVVRVWDKISRARRKAIVALVQEPESVEE